MWLGVGGWKADEGWGLAGWREKGRRVFVQTKRGTNSDSERGRQGILLTKMIVTGVWELGSDFSSSPQHPMRGNVSWTAPLFLSVSGEFRKPLPLHQEFAALSLPLFPCQPFISPGCADLKVCWEKEVLFLSLLSHCSARGHRRWQPQLVSWSAPRSKKGFAGSGCCLELLVCKILSCFSPHFRYPCGIFVSSNNPFLGILHSLSDCEHCPLLPELSPLNSQLNYDGFLCPSWGNLRIPKPNTYLWIQIPLYCWFFECQRITGIIQTYFSNVGWTPVPHPQIPRLLQN